MNSDLLKAKKMLHEGAYTCVLCKSDKVYTSNERGVKPLLDWLDSNININDFCAADKVIGKAAAFLYVLANVCEVYADVISEPAKAVFEKYNIRVYYKTCVTAIRNRNNTGFCPMETAVKDIDNSIVAKEKIIETLRALKNT